MAEKPKKGGVTKQDRRRQHQQGVRPPVHRQGTHAGLAPALYTALHDIQRPTSQPLTILGRQRLEESIAKVKESIADMEKSLKTARDLLDIFRHPENEYVQASIVRLIDTISANLVEARQRLSRRQMEADADAFQLSWQVAYELQELEVRSHDRWIGRLDRPRQVTRPPTRPPTLRSSNVPSPIRRVDRPGPSQRPPNVRQLTMDEFVVRTDLNEAASSTPPSLPEAVKDEPQADEAVSSEDEEYEPVTRCIHHRLHRCGNTSDLRGLKRLLKKSCARTCGKKMIPIRKMTLCKPLPPNLKSNLNPQFSQLACEAGDVSETEDNVVVLPPIVIQQSPRVVINSNERQAAEDALTEQILQGSTVPLVTIESTTSEEEDSVDEPIEQVDGVINAEQILNIDENDRSLRTADIMDGTGGRYDVDDTVDSDQNLEGYVLAFPVRGNTFAGVRTPERPWYDTPEPQNTPCLCEDYYLHGFCWHHPRITDPADLSRPPHEFH